MGSGSRAAKRKKGTSASTAAKKRFAKQRADHQQAQGEDITATALKARNTKRIAEADLPTLQKLAQSAVENLRKARAGKQREARARKKAEKSVGEGKRVQQELEHELNMERERAVQADKLSRELGEQLLESQAEAARERREGEEVVRKLQSQVAEHASSREKVLAENRKIIDAFFPESNGDSSLLFSGDDDGASSPLPAADQLLRSQMEEEQAKRQLEATAAWGRELRKNNAALRKKEARQEAKLKDLSAKNTPLEKAAPTSEARPVLGDRDKSAHETILDNLRTFQDGEESSSGGESEGGDEEQAGAEKQKGKGRQRRRAYGMTAARLAQRFLTGGTPLCQVGPLIMETIHASTGVQLNVPRTKTQFTSKTVKQLALGVAHLDMAELIKAIKKAPYLLIAGDESLRKGDKKFPIFVAFWDVDAQVPWWGVLRVCSMKDKKATTQAELFHDTIKNVVGYPRHQVLYVLSDNTASVSAEKGGCVTLLREKLEEDEAKEVQPTAGARAGGARGGGGGSRRGRGRGRGRGR